MNRPDLLQKIASFAPSQENWRPLDDLLGQLWTAGVTKECLPGHPRSFSTFAMLLRALLFCPILFLSAAVAIAQPCVQVRTSPERIDCVHFTEAEKANAESYGLQLGEPYARVRRHLLSSGWRPDPNWASEGGSANAPDGLVCGRGLDAACSSALLRADRRVILHLSAVNAGLPLTGIEEEPAR